MSKTRPLYFASSQVVVESVTKRADGSTYTESASASASVIASNAKEKAHSLAITRAITYLENRAKGSKGIYKNVEHTASNTVYRTSSNVGSCKGIKSCDPIAIT